MDIKQTFLTVEDIKKIYGGKGFYLLWLNKQLSKMNKPSAEVPPFRIIPIQECKNFLKTKEFDREKALSYYKNLPRRKYSVRSGAEKSLPGLMDTILFVKYNEVPERIKEVFQSFTKIPEDIREGLEGTAAIVQCMATVLPKNDVAVGVVFPKIKDNRVELTFRYKKRIGDDIVSGKSEEDGVMNIVDNVLKATINTDKAFYQVPILRIFENYLKTFHHPSEFEIIIDFTRENLFFLQARDYKTTPEEAEIWIDILEGYKLSPSKDLVDMASKSKIVTEINQLPDFEGEGEGIATGKLTKKDYKKKKYIKYIESGVSLEWINSVKNPNCVGIAFSTGSLHCHGVVLAKGYGKAYIKIPKKAVEEFIDLPEITIIDGNIYTNMDIKIKENELKIENNKEKEIIPKILRSKITQSDVFNETKSVEDIGKYKLAILDRIPSEELEEVLNATITRFVLWGILSTIGESRHIDLLSNSYILQINRKMIFKYFDFSDIDISASNTLLEGLIGKCGGGSKKTYIYLPLLDIIRKGISKERLYKTVELVELIFKDPNKAVIKTVGNINLLNKYEENKSSFIIPYEQVIKSLAGFAGGFGGKRWGKIAEATKNLIEILGKPTKISKVLALLNEIEALQHNNAIFFNKFIDTYPILNIYNAFNNGENQFISYLKFNYPDIFNNYLSDEGYKEKGIDINNIPIEEIF